MFGFDLGQYRACGLRHLKLTGRRSAHGNDQHFILTTIVAAFVLFGIVLAWGEYQTRHLVRDRKRGREKDGLSNTPEPVLRVKFNQAAKAVESDLTKAA